MENGNEVEICKWLSLYIIERRSCKGEPYPPKSLYQLLSGLLRHFRFQNPTFPNFLDKNNHKFKTFHALLDNLFKGLKKEGIGSESKHAEIISKEEEKILWDTNLLNLTTSKGLLRAVFYYNGKIFFLRGGSEHRNLKLSQFTRY